MGVNQLSLCFIRLSVWPREGMIVCLCVRVCVCACVCVWSLPCSGFGPLTMLGWGTPHVCRIRVWEILAESISWATEGERFIIIITVNLVIVFVCTIIIVKNLHQSHHCLDDIVISAWLRLHWLDLSTSSLSTCGTTKLCGPLSMSCLTWHYFLNADYDMMLPTHD